MGEYVIGFIFDYISGELSDSYMVNDRQLGEVPSDCLNEDNLAIRDEDGSFMKFVCLGGKGEGYYISSLDGTKISEWDLYEHMAHEDDERYDVLYGIEEDDDGSMILTN